MRLGLPADVVFRGTPVGAFEVRQIRRLMAEHRDRTQLEIARRVCRHFGWYRPNGDLADRACVDLLGRLQSRRLIRLPPPRCAGGVWKTAPAGESPAELQWPVTDVSTPLPPTDGLVVRPISALERSAWRNYIARHHYLGWRPLVGESLCYVAFLKRLVVGLIGWAAAALKNTPRDAYIGWDWPTK